LLICGQPSKQEMVLINNITTDSKTEFLTSCKEYSFHTICNDTDSFVCFSKNPLGGIHLIFSSDIYSYFISILYKEALSERFDGKARKKNTFIY
jgi:hypothetical protein